MIQKGVAVAVIQNMTQRAGCYFFSLFFFRDAPAAHGRSQARGRIRATAAGLHHSHSNAGSKLRLRPTLQLTETPVLYPLIEARD